MREMVAGKHSQKEKARKNDSRSVGTAVRLLWRAAAQALALTEFVY